MHHKTMPEPEADRILAPLPGPSNTYYELGPHETWQFSELFRQARRSCRRLVRQPEYGGLAQGTPPDDAWADLVAETTGRGVRMQRLIVIDVPPSDHQRLLLAMAQFHVKAGECVRLVSGPPADAARRCDTPSMPNDVWLIDDLVVHTLFHPRWRCDDGIIVCAWPSRTRWYREVWDQAWARSQSLSAVSDS